MCGIAGAIFKKGYNDFSFIDMMLNRINHRGPDDRGLCGITFENQLITGKCYDEIKNAYLKGIVGFNRLSIRDLSMAGHQPMLSSDGLISLVFNGEIYNSEKLKHEFLKEEAFYSTSDTEVILKLYLKFGLHKTLQLLNGMFAIGIIDSRKQKLYMARDRFGIIPFHFINNENYLAFASEIKCFMELPGFEKKISSHALDEYLYSTYPNVPLYQDVYNLEPGEILEFDYQSDSIIFDKFFDINCLGLDQSQKYHNISFVDAVDECKSLLEEATAGQLISDVPVGLQLSGGIDSSLVAGIGKSKNEKLEAFSIVNEDARYNEEKYIDYVAQKYNIHVHKTELHIDEFLNNFEKSMYAFERFINLPSPIGIFSFARDASQSVTVLLSGEGADEIAGGYTNFKRLHLNNYLSKVNKIIPSKTGIFPVEEGKKRTFDNFLSGSDKRLNARSCRALKKDFDIDTIYPPLGICQEITGQ